MATTESNKAEIDLLADTASNLGKATKRQADDITKLTAEITKLTAEIDKLKLSKAKVPAMPPPIFDSKKLTFHTWANFAKNYFVRSGIDSEFHIGLLLTYLSPNDYSAVSRVYNMDELAGKSYDKATDLISHIISDKVDRSKAVSRLLGLRQGNLSIQQFLDKLAEMAEIGFPEEDMEDAKQRCLISALQSTGVCLSNVRCLTDVRFAKIYLHN